MATSGDATDKKSRIVAAERERGEKMTLAKRVKRMAEIRDVLDRTRERKAELEAVHDLYRLQLIPDKMAEEGLENTKVTGVGRVTLTGDLHATIPANQREEAYAWLRENGFGDLITETVNASTFKAFAKDRIKEGDALPEDVFRIVPFTRAAITKGK